MKFYFHSILIGQINEKPIKLTNENSLKSSFTEFSVVIFHWVFTKLSYENAMKIKFHCTEPPNENFTFFLEFSWTKSPVVSTVYMCVM